jgi:hypothetical protein
VLLKTFGWSFAVTALGLVAAAFYGGWEAFGIVAILAVLEISLSFDNAVVNAGILKKMSAFWQKIFLTVGVLIAVFGMRLAFPVVIVAITAKKNPIDAVDLALTDKDRYEQLVTDAHPSIAAFGGMFLLMIFLDFIFDSEKEHHWLGGLERMFGRLGEHDSISSVVSLVVLISMSLGLDVADRATFLFAGVFGIALYFAMGLLKNAFEDKEAGEAVVSTVKRSGFMSFCYLELVDASFSLDGVIGAFAMSNDPIIIMLGLAIGALFVRSITLHLVRKGVLQEFVYLEHGAHYAIGVLAAIMLCHKFMHVPEIVTGLAGAVLIILAIVSSILHKKAEEKSEATAAA